MDSKINGGLWERIYYDAIELGLLDKDNPAEDFYEKKHLSIVRQFQ